MHSPTKIHHKDRFEKPGKSQSQINPKDPPTQISRQGTPNTNAQNYLSHNDFHQLLTEYNIPTSQTDIDKTVKKTGKNSQVPLSSLKYMEFRKPSPAARSYTMSPAKRTSSINIEKSILDRSTEISLQNASVSLNNFFQSIESRLKSLDLVVDYFFLNRGEEIDFEEFSESCFLLVGNEFDLHTVFVELADKNLKVTKIKFFKVLNGIGKGDANGVQVVREKMKKKFGNLAKGFEALVKNGRVSLSELFCMFGVRNLPAGMPLEFGRYEFKKFWFDKENICKVDFCVHKIKEYDLCDTHFKGFILRGEEALRKITATNPPEKILPIITTLLTCLNNKQPITHLNIQKRDVQALQIYLRYKQDQKKQIILY